MAGINDTKTQAEKKELRHGVKKVEKDEEMLSVKDEKYDIDIDRLANIIEPKQDRFRKVNPEGSSGESSRSENLFGESDSDLDRCPVDTESEYDVPEVRKRRTCGFKTAGGKNILKRPVTA